MIYNTLSHFRGVKILLPHPVHSKWTLLKSCCFFLISLRSITNLAHDFKSPFLDIEITISILFWEKFRSTLEIGLFKVTYFPDG